VSALRSLELDGPLSDDSGDDMVPRKRFLRLILALAAAGVSTASFAQLDSSCMVSAFNRTALALGTTATLSSTLHGIDIKVDKVPVSIVAEYLRTHKCAAVSFIDSGQRSVVSLDLRDATIEEVLSKIAAQSSTYRNESIAGRDVLYPTAPEFQATVDNVDIQHQPRQEATELYVDLLRRAVPAFPRLVPPVLFGDNRMPIYTDKVSLRPKGRVIEHFVDLLGEDHSLYFKFIKARSGLPSLEFERLSC
jgi:hypothetical protein